MPVCVMVPGLGLGVAAVAPTLRHLDPASRAVCLPGYGRRADGDADLSPAALARILVAQLREPTILVGHSASCQVVAEVAASEPPLVAGMVLIGPTTDPRDRGWAGLAQRWLRTACWERPRQVPLLVREYARTGLGSMLRGMDAARAHRIDEALGRSSAPLLVIRGRHDRIAPEDWCRTLAPDSTLSLTAGAHMVPLTHGAEVAAAITRWATAR